MVAGDMSSKWQLSFFIYCKYSLLPFKNGDGAGAENPGSNSRALCTFPKNKNYLGLYVYTT